MKDNFSIQSDDYARYRPTYPKELYDFLIPQVSDRIVAWDCGTGNGQVAQKLSNFFEKVYATDISARQITNAMKKPNIEYRIESAGKSSFLDNQFDLITVAQAIHWFDLEKFYSEVQRTLKSNGIIAVIGYTLVRFNHEIDGILDQFYNDILGDYWDDARILVEEHYRTLPFPFKEIQTIDLKYTKKWSLHELLGYLSTWSALQNYLNKNKKNPLGDVEKKLKKYWDKDMLYEGSIPVFMQTGRV